VYILYPNQPSDASNTFGVIQNGGNDLFEGIYLYLSPSINFDNSKLVTFDFYSNLGKASILIKK
jgi:hypothetical protein